MCQYIFASHAMCLLFCVLNFLIFNCANWFLDMVKNFSLFSGMQPDSVRVRLILWPKKMKDKKYHTVGTVHKCNQEIVGTKAIIP